jgi:hypothetical protein
MSHFSVLILGDEPEEQLEPFAELSAIDGPLAEDWRAAFVTEVSRDRFAAAAREITVAAEAAGAPYAPRYRALLTAENYRELFADFFGGDLGPEGDWGYYENPRSNWDWYVLGGRFQGRLCLLPGRRGVSGERSWTNADAPVLPGSCDQASAGAIDWAATRKTFTPFAVLKDGEWHARGEMGWFGCVADPQADADWQAEADALFSGLPPETLVSVYDCHI